MTLPARLFKRAVLVTGLAFAIITLTSCKTIEGLGRDIQNTGNAMQNAANQ